MRDSQQITCMTIIYNTPRNQSFRKRLRQNMTKSETVLWKNIKGDRLGHRFRRQYGVGNYIVDFYCPTLKLAIEVDGFTHADEKVFEKDEIKQKYLESLGIMVKRYSSEQVFKTINEVIADLYQTCDEIEKKRLGDNSSARLGRAPPLKKGRTMI